MSSEDVIQYVPFSSFVDAAFWHTLTRVKLDVDRLDERERSISGYYCYRDDLPALLEVDGTSFNRVPRAPPPFCESIVGSLVHKNTIESFKNVDKAEFLNTVGAKYWESIKGREWITSPNKLHTFMVLAFSDLKKYHYYYWFAYPAPSQPVVYFAQKPKPISEHLNETQISSLAEGHKALDVGQKSFFLIVFAEEIVQVKPLSYLLEENRVDIKNIQYGFSDPSNGCYPGWPLRNYIAAILEYCPSLTGTVISVFGLRCKMNGDIAPSVYFQIKIPEDVKPTESNGWVGWERNDRGKFIPKLANMSASMDPSKLAEDSADLNLKLMKWRLVPNIDLDVMKETKCLLLGAGTLGCHVARNLLAWGFRHITFLDNGKVSYSNPVRQVLYTHRDCRDGGLRKAEAAAANLKGILPTVSSKGIVSHIPMPGHPVGESLRKETLDSIETITAAIVEHDVVFLLLDSREARWLPTLLAAHFGKVAINAALGFDSYLVMRHGISAPTAESSEPVAAAATPSASTSGDAVSSAGVAEATTSFTCAPEYVPGHQLGCYFCNDVTAPGNSQKDRTLDQQCTVSRPGVSAIAAALAVEMTVALLQHRLRGDAPAASNLCRSLEQGLDPAAEGPLGPVPHSLRGFLASHHTLTPTCVRFAQCVACSGRVLAEYRARGNDFLMEVFGDASHLERVTGLTELHVAAEMLDVMALSDEDSDEMTDVA